MLARAIIGLQRLFLLVVLSVALTATGFAHRMTGPQDQAMANALAMGVLPADFCGDSPDGGTARPHCLACQIAASTDHPAPFALRIDLELAFVAKVSAPRVTRAASRVLDPGHSPQGPPAA